MIVGISFYGWAIANMTNILEDKSSMDSITLQDLDKTTVATKIHSTSEKFLLAKGVSYSTYDNVEGALSSLLLGQSNAVVFDEASLKYILRKSKNANLHLLPENLSQQFYGFAMNKGSKLRKKINIALLQMKEDGTLEKIKQKWL